MFDPWWYRYHAREVGDCLSNAAEAGTEQIRKGWVRQAFAARKKAESRLQKAKAKLQSEELANFELWVVEMEELAREILMAEMPEEERQFCQSVLDWWQKSDFRNDQSALAIIIATVAGARYEIHDERRIRLIQKANGRDRPVPDVLADTFRRYGEGSVDKATTIEALDKMTALVKKHLPLLIHPEL